MACNSCRRRSDPPPAGYAAVANSASIGIIGAFKDKAPEDDRQPVFDEKRDVLLGRGIRSFDTGNLVPQVVVGA